MRDKFHPVFKVSNKLCVQVCKRVLDSKALLLKAVEKWWLSIRKLMLVHNQNAPKFRVHWTHWICICSKRNTSEILWVLLASHCQIVRIAKVTQAACKFKTANHWPHCHVNQ